ncbi:toxin-antitoxin system YwqK family antitoxin [Flagellimonas sp.]|uniref:toxin-antitoxin system YwqK family antitoxin n=1 Tax=Flagellimonas sp. TaxID=2058762 RepID=UPI003BA92ECC
MISITKFLAKLFISSLLFSLTSQVYAQKRIPMSQTVTKREVSMANAAGKRSDGMYRYYAKGDDKPFTGILFAKYSNGKYASWQEYENGIGQGKWINYYENGNFKEVGHYNHNLVEGPIKKYYENGALKAEGNYKDWRIKVGVWKYYNLNGTLRSTIDYGKKGSIEEVQQFYEKGEISYSWYSDILSKNGFKE